jgi:glycosyltransferase involved in cell wall biosynthesis
MTQRQDKGSVVIIRSNEVAPDPRVETHAKTLHEDGWNVTILAWDRAAAMADEDRDYAHIVRLRVRAPYGARFRNVPRKLRWNLWLLQWLIGNRRKYTHIHACDLDTAVPALIAKVLFGKKLVYDVFDNTLLQIASQDNVRKRPKWYAQAAGRVIAWVEDQIVKRANAVIMVDECREETLRVKPARLEFIYNSPDALPLAPVRRSGAPFRIAYVGQLSLERGLVEMLDAIARRPEFVFDLAGFGADEEALRAKAASLPNVTWHGRVSRDTAMEISRNADVLFATYDPVLPFHKYSSANKLFEAMMLGKPIIVARDTGMDAVVARNDTGIVVDYGDLDQLDCALLTVAHMSDAERQGLAARTRRLYEERYSAEIMRRRLLALYAGLM